MLHGGHFTCFILIYSFYVSAIYVVAHQPEHTELDELRQYVYEVRGGVQPASRIRRSNRVVHHDPSEGVKNVGNTTRHCIDDSCNITETFTDSQNHQYYNSFYYSQGSNLFVDLAAQHKLKHNLTVEKHEKLSNSYKKAFRVNIDFHFPFYGNYVDKIIVTTGGFINIGPKFHSFVHKVHYIAPLMADFNPSANNKSVVYIAKGNGVVIVQWNDFLLNGKQYANKTFTFQVCLFKNGTVVMAYKNIPLPPAEIKIPRRKVGITVGFADGFIITYQRHDAFKVVIHNYIYSYHKISFPLTSVKDGAAYKLDLLPNCIQFKTCKTCLNDSKYISNFTCRWCPVLRQCSDALDWHRQRWLNFCQNYAYSDSQQCTDPTKEKIKKMKKRLQQGSGKSATGIIIGMLLFLLVVGGGSVFIYAYTHPLSKPGLWLMENRRPWKRFQKLAEDEYA